MAAVAEVVIVGGGIIGAATAYELARREIRVTLIERAALAAGASGRNHGLLLTPLDEALLPMARAGLPMYREAAERTASVDLDPDVGRFLLVAVEPGERADGEAEALAAERSGVRIERIDREALRNLEPALSPDLEEGWLLHDGLRVDPAALTVALAQLAARHGADIRRHLPARQILARQGAGTGILADDGRIEADLVVVAAGPWSPGLVRPLGLHLPVVGARGWLVHVRPTARAPRMLVGRAGWHMLPRSEPLQAMRAGDLGDDGPETEVGTLIQPNPHGTLLLGGSRRTAISPEPDDPWVPSEIVRGAMRLVPSIAQADVLSAWSGVRPMTPDGRPIVDRVSDRVVVAAGHGSQGVILAAGTAALVASIATGDPMPFDPAPFSLGRFRNIGL